MWGYFGAKTSVVNYYPPPKYGRIIEPFSGTARYSLKYFERDVLLVDKYPVIINIWKWLQKCSQKDVLGLPRRFKPGQLIDDFKYDCPEARDLIGFLIGFGMERPRLTASAKRMEQRGNHVNFGLQRIAKNLFKIKHWKIREGDYSSVPIQADTTYFVDPPYFIGGNTYVHGSKNIDYDKLSAWCRKLKGQIIVCENTKATWLPFHPLITHKGSNGMQAEAIWTNTPIESTKYRAQKMFE